MSPPLSKGGGGTGRRQGHRVRRPHQVTPIMEVRSRGSQKRSSGKVRGEKEVAPQAGLGGTAVGGGDRSVMRLVLPAWYWYTALVHCAWYPLPSTGTLRLVPPAWYWYPAPGTPCLVLVPCAWYPPAWYWYPAPGTPLPGTGTLRLVPPCLVLVPPCLVLVPWPYTWYSLPGTGTLRLVFPAWYWYAGPTPGTPCLVLVPCAWYPLPNTGTLRPAPNTPCLVLVPCAWYSLPGTGTLHPARVGSHHSWQGASVKDIVQVRREKPVLGPYSEKEGPTRDIREMS